MTIYKSQGCGAFTGSPCGAPNRKPPLSPARPIVTSRSQWSNINGVLNGDLFISYTLTRLVPRGGENPPPPRFFSNLEKCLSKYVFYLNQIHFLTFWKKKSCKSVKRLGHSNYVLEVYGGGDFLPLTFFLPARSPRGGWFCPPPCRIFVYRPILMKFWYDDVINVNSQKNWPYVP